MDNTRFRLIRILIVVLLIFGNLIWINYVYRKLSGSTLVSRSNLAKRENLNITNLNESKVNLVEADFNSREDYDDLDSPKLYQMKQDLFINATGTSSSSSSQPAPYIPPQQ